VIVPDINLLVYAHNDQAREHEAAKCWWEDCLNGSIFIGLPWVVVAGFIRLMTHPRVLQKPMPACEATSHVRKWMAQTPVRILEPGNKFSGIYLGQLEDLGTAGNLTTDAWLAALAMEHQAELHSADADFSRFQGLRWKNPLRPK
jgi:uncharacterized protein